ncbi:hypothetical protein C0Q70_21051 [Pomacea canaliculata]|uniref:S-formylglutathione hydrolase n=1 Tax=Pomacea canaliculata TaxID=400727 RepID=A0A2T7NBH6_POMCA|nr:hypothetical protein C0Q70_21051 [Pomacea canaliculata]
MANLQEVSSNKIFGGYQKVYSHESTELKCVMRFAVYLPPAAETGKVPVLYWLSGLTCTEQNFITKAGVQKYASELGLIIVAPDTSPRGIGIQGEDDSYDFGTGAGFYVDATQDKWKNNYRMYSYVTRENPGMFRSVSAFAPICNPIKCPWGQKAFTGYLGTDTQMWEQYDATSLIAKYSGPSLELFVDQGKEDNFLSDGQLLPDRLMEACTVNKVPIILRMQEGYDHSYYFIATFIEDHVRHHAKFLKV